MTYARALSCANFDCSKSLRKKLKREICLPNGVFSLAPY